MRYLLCGPMSGKQYVNYNMGTFSDAAFVWRNAGFIIINPIEVFQTLYGKEWDKQSRATYLRFTMQTITADDVDGIIVITGYEKASGVLAEIALALLRKK